MKKNNKAIAKILIVLETVVSTQTQTVSVRIHFYTILLLAG